MNKGIIIGIVVALVILIGIAVLIPISIKNGLIAKDETVNEAWAQIETQLQRRIDLIPNLVNTVKGYAKHEKEVFTAVSNARAQLLSAQTPTEKANANGMVKSSLGRLLAIAEKYPDLKANESFIRLQDELAGTENRIAVSRGRYNARVKEYNASIRKFPGSMFAASLKLEKRDYFQASPQAKAAVAPKVEF
jgi:LemA protein